MVVFFPNWTQSIVSQKAKDANLITNDPIEGAADVKGAPNWKKTGWLGFSTHQIGKPVQMNLSCITVFWDGRI